MCPFQIAKEDVLSWNGVKVLPTVLLYAPYFGRIKTIPMRLCTEMDCMITTKKLKVTKLLFLQ